MNVSLSRPQYNVIYIFLISLVLALKIRSVGSSTTLIDCAAIVDGPFIEGQDSPSDINLLKGNETDPVVINCQVTCLNHSVPDLHHNPRLALIVTKLGTFKDVQGANYSNDTEDGLYQSIIYTPSNNCEQANNYTMQYTFAIYPTIKMDRTVARCGVSYHPGRPHCWGEAVTFIRYNTSMADDITYITIATMPAIMMSETGGSGGNLVTIFSPLVGILALALVVVITIAIIEGVIIAASCRPPYHNHGIEPLNVPGPDKASVGSVTPPHELRGKDPSHDQSHQ